MSRALMRELYGQLKDNGMLEYGAEIPRDLLLELLAIEVPQTATRDEWARLELQEMSAVDYVRNLLLDQGKYLERTRSGYRVALPSENMAQVDNYMSAADKKIRRGQRLLRSTPEQYVTERKDESARLHLRQREDNSRRPNVGRTTPAEAR